MTNFGKPKTYKEDMFKLTYTNEDDRAFGLAGMAISLAQLDAIDRIVEISLDSQGPMVTFSQQYFYGGSPAVSPKASWENMMRNFQITSSMVIANVMARSLVRLGEEVPQEVMETIYGEISAEGADECGLEEDETRAFYNRLLTLNRRIFGNPRLRPAVAELAHRISRRRRLSGMEIQDEINLLQF